MGILQHLGRVISKCSLQAAFKEQACVQWTAVPWPRGGGLGPNPVDCSCTCLSRKTRKSLLVPPQVWPGEVRSEVPWCCLRRAAAHALLAVSAHGKFQSPLWGSQRMRK